MKKIFLAFILLLIFACSAFAENWRYAKVEAERFAKDYQREIEEKNVSKVGTLRFDTGLRAGYATYKEKEQNIKSDYSVVFPELFAAAKYRSEQDFEAGLDFSFGRSLTDKETWDVNDIEYQTNDLDFYRIAIKGTLGKAILLKGFRNLCITPYLGYGFTFFDFERKNFNILNIITITETVSEKYYIQHGGVGARLELPINEKFSLSGSGYYGYIFFNEADNNALGKITGKKGYLLEADINASYSLTERWRLLLGGYFEYQSLKGGSKNNVIWPNNTFDVFGGRISAQYTF